MGLQNFVRLLDRLDNLSDETIDKTLSVNIGGTLRMMREALPALRDTKGQIINISSTAVNTHTIAFISAYSASKAAIEHLTRSLADELGPSGIRVNAVAPGITMTELAKDGDQEVIEKWRQQTPLRRVGRPEEVASVVVGLARDEMSWVTGQVIAASGGLFL